MLSVAAWLMLGSMLYALRLDHPGSFPKPLRAAEEREYLLRARAGDREARNILIERNLRLVAHIVKKYYAQNVDQEDLISIGTVGLIKAIASFDPDKGVRLATYAARCVENEILMYFRAQKKTASDVSLSDYLETGKDGTALSIEDVVASPEDLFSDLAQREDHLRLRRAVARVLTERERQVVIHRYGLYGQPMKKQQQVADLLGISRSYVSRIEKHALEKLRAEFERRE